MKEAIGKTTAVVLAHPHAFCGMASILPAMVRPSKLIPVRRGVYLINDHLLARAAVAKSVLDMFRTLDDLLPLFIPLNRREIKVLDFVAVERINKKSGTALDIVERTVKMHVVSILRKMGVNERMHAVVAAIRHGWVTVKE